MKKKKKYYYIPFSHVKTELEYVSNFYGTIQRAGEWLQFEDYPTHRHESYGYVYVMELIPEKRMMSVKYLHSHIGRFFVIEVDQNEIFKEDGRYWLKEFEKTNNTTIYKQHYIKGE